MYVETDFLVALFRPDDWLHEQASATVEVETRDVHTSLLAYVEFLVLAYEPGTGVPFDVPHVVANLLEAVPIEPERDEEAALAAATFLDEHDTTPFDAFHGGISITGDGKIHSSDGIYDELGLDRHPLEPEEK